MKLKICGRSAVCALAIAATGGAHAISATGTINGSEAKFSFQEYQYDPLPNVGNGLVDSNTLFFFKEKEVNGEQSWYIFFDPKCKGMVDAEITFDNSIVGVIRDSAGLLATNTKFGVGDIYESVKHTGLEYKDKATWVGDTLHIRWKAGDPGDHMRVLTTPVPEPQTYALLMAGLGALTVVARRRKLAQK